MPPEVVAKAFEPFFSTKPPGAGTGLGLSQVFGFVKQSKGHVKICSEPDRGTRIKIFMPRLHGEGAALPTAGGQCLAASSNSEMILLVEDDGDVLDFTARMLRDLGYRVIPARSGEEALRAMDAHPEVRLLFTDVVLPDIQGRELADQALRRRSDLRIPFTTGYTHDAVAQGGVLDPRTNLLLKPASFEQLATKVRAALDGRS